MNRKIALTLLLAGAAGAAAAQEPAAGGLPRWEAGIAAGGGRIPDYPGADQSHWRAIVVPWFVYRGPVVSVDERGIRSRFVDTSHWELDLTATAAFNTRSNDRREGMPELDYLFGIGPQLVYKGWQGAGGNGASAHFKLRAIQSTDFRRIDSRGGTFSTELRWREFGVLGAGSVLTASIEPTWASRPLQRYFYGVGADQATATRPAYEARAGYLGTEFGLSLRRRIASDLSWFVAVDLNAMHGAANRASPLLASKTNLSFGAGLVWTPWRSTAAASD
ncbi:MAG: MipA/OmpV family protein [Piscinibacter sp.]|uniref:MipA/OmpV family protein n=1 Tax=Piscinibacter sp. TaxID=1903157 RepID=UPI003D12F835